MSMTYFPISLCLQFLSTVSYSFQFFTPWLNLFLGIFYFFVMIVNEIAFLMCLFAGSLLLYKNATGFYILICTLQLYCILKNVLFIYFWLRWVSIAAHSLCLVVASGGSLYCGMWALQCGGFPCCRSGSLELAGFSSCGAGA